MNNDYVLELRNISKQYSGVTALDGVSLTLKKGEVLGLIGANGAGKSTLIKCCCGDVIPSSGSIVIDGIEYAHLTPRLAIEKGIAVIYQEFNNVPELSVAENMFLGDFKKKAFVLDKKAMEDESKEVFKKLHIDIDPKEKMKNLSVAYQQMVEIARAIRQDAHILIMDEPSAPLTENEVSAMLEMVGLLKEKAVSIIYISHRLEEIMKITDRVEIIGDGKYIDTLETKNTNIDTLVTKMAGHEISRKFPERENCINKSNICLELISVSGPAVNDISFKLYEGEVLGIGGLVGSGRTLLAQLIFGISQKTGGKIIYYGQEIDIKSPGEAVKKGIALVSEDRKRYGAVIEDSVKHNINLPIYDTISNFGIIKSKEEKGIAEKFKDKLSIKCTDIDMKLSSLSGGNQQKVVLSKWLASDAKLIIFDEPTRGIDIESKYEIYKLINSLVKEGKSIIMISSEIEELMGMSDRIVVLAEHKLVGELLKEEFDPDLIMAMSSDVKYNKEHF